MEKELFLGKHFECLILDVIIEAIPQKFFPFMFPVIILRERTAHYKEITFKIRLERNAALLFLVAFLRNETVLFWIYNVYDVLKYSDYLGLKRLQR